MPTDLRSPQHDRPSLLQLRWRIFRTQLLLLAARLEMKVLRLLLAARGRKQ
jgi:hypothetical protein